MVTNLCSPSQIFTYKLFISEVPGVELRDLIVLRFFYHNILVRMLHVKKPIQNIDWIEQLYKRLI